ncbi:MAG: penicillin-binding protein 1C [Chthoniobacteraceae bacterium]
MRGLAVALLLAWFGLKLVPIPAALLKPAVQSREFTDRHGVTLREVRVDDRFAREVTIDEIPPRVVHAMLAAEDKRFFQHGGVDVFAIGRALWGNATHQRVLSGASTITQQLVKISDPRPRTLRTKCLEALRAIRLEQMWRKPQILAAYFNRLDFGNLNIGIASAANYYFGKPLADLSDAEAAFLAGLPKNPTRLNPHRATRAAKRRQEIVLGRMEKAGWLTVDQTARARAEALHLQAPQRLFRAPHFVDLVLRDLPADAPATVATTLDLDLNRFVEGAVRDQLVRLHAKNVHDAAAVVIDNATGDVLALVGSQNYFAPGTGQVNGAWTRRSAGSTFKPFTYLLALERGASPATIAADVPVTFPTPTGIFRPENYSHRCYGPLRYRLALANSLNIPAVRVLASIGGAAPLQERLRDWGMMTLNDSAEHYGLGLTIGNAETRLIELANAYATLARMGDWRPYRLMETRSVENVQLPTSNARPSTDMPLAAWLVADMLSDNAARAISFGMQSALRFDFPVACKTGTSSDFRDNWAVGYTPEFTVAVWAGNFDNSPMRDVSGVTGAAPIMHAVMNQLHARYGTSWFSTPREIVEREVHPITGRLLTSSRPDAVREKFIVGKLPPEESPGDYDANARAVLGPEFGEWSRSAENGMTARTAVEPGESPLRVVGPLPGTTFLVDPDLPSSGRVPLRASGPSAIKWECDSLEVRETDGRTFAIAKEGDHKLVARDPATGRTAETWIRVKML